MSLAFTASSNGSVDLSDLGHGLGKDHAVRLVQKFEDASGRTNTNDSEQEMTEWVATADIVVGEQSYTFEGTEYSKEGAIKDLKNTIKAAL